VIIFEKRKASTVIKQGPSYGWTRDTTLTREEFALAVEEIAADFKYLGIRSRLKRALRRGRFNWETPDGEIVVIKREKK
jgi:hypothetical protein